MKTIKELRKLAITARLALNRFEDTHNRKLNDEERLSDHNFLLSSDESENHVMDLNLDELQIYHTLILVANHTEKQYKEAVNENR